MESIMTAVFSKIRNILASDRGSEHVQTATLVLIAVVIGLLLMEAFFGIFSTIIIPNVTSKLQDIFGYTG
ncbi:MAG: DUF6133 family protein [Clostridiales Family XIII bacterium]|nr:DUF6133 family protein [Clostridiales Family XIII bacterium]